MFFGFREIKADPPHIGLVTIWGKRFEIIKSEGWTFLAPYFPFLYKTIDINIEKKNKDYEFKNVRCKFELPDKDDSTKKIRSGGSVTVVASITWIPNDDSGEEMIKYIDSGKKDGVEEILKDKMAEEIRQAGRTHTWEEMVFATQVLSADLIISIVGPDIEIEGTDGTKESWQWRRSIERNLLQKDDQGSEEEKAEKLRVAMKFLNKALRNGVGDDHDLGIKILRLNIKSVEPEGELKKDAEEAAKEAQQRRAEQYETETITRQGQILFDFYKETTDPRPMRECVNQAWNMKQLKEGKGNLHKIDLSGIPKEIIEKVLKIGG